MEILFGAAAVVALVVGGGVCGILALVRLQDVSRRLTRIERQLSRIQVRPDGEEIRARFAPEQAAAEREIEELPEAESAASPEEFARTAEERVRAERAASSEPRAPEFERQTEPAPALRGEWSSFELTVGTQWLNWVGIVLVTIGVLFFLKFAYDNQWIGPRGRIAIGAVLGAAALVVGEKSRRAGYPTLFHTLTGGGLAAFYGCIYFSFQIYQLTGQSLSFFLLLIVTGLALTLSVAHNAPLICLFGQLGGFLSPILISTGQNRPLQLFSFLAVLNLATMGCAYFKDWKIINVVAFAGTWLLYAGWAAKFYDVSQLGTALFFSTLFYLIFLIVPTLRASARREALSAENLWLVAVNTVVEFVNNDFLLYENYRAWLGAAVITEALTLCALYAYWARRCWEDTKTRVTLLFAALALVTVAVPIQLRLYGIPIAWALEALLLGFIGVQYRQWVFQFASVIAIVLAAGGLVVRLPLHIELFTPVFNRPFGSWAIVIAMSFALSFLFHRGKAALDESLKQTPAVILVLAAVLFCALLHMEISTFWDVRREIWRSEIARSYQYTSLTVLWAAIPLILLWLGRNRILAYSIPAALAAYTVGVIVILQGAAAAHWIAWTLPFVNLQWLSRALFCVSLWIAAGWMRSVPDRPEKWDGWTPSLHAVEAAGHVILAVLIYVEVDTWISASRVFSSLMRFGFVSALWSLQALTLIGVGLRTRSGFRRIVGFVLFGVTVAKLLLIDMAILQPVYRIVSFAVTGFLLIVAAYLYQKFSKMLLEAEPQEPTSPKKAAS